MIYIDPPYNTGKDFIYKDNFKENVADYYERTGQSKNGIRLTTNFESGGRYHSDWLTMMYPRLFFAKSLLREDGVIFISIDDNEVHNLRHIMDEIFGQENFVQDFMWLHGKGKKDKNSRTLQQYVLCYAKNKDILETWTIEKLKEYQLDNPDNDKRGGWFSGSISFSEERSNKKHPNYFKIKSPSGVEWERQWQCSKDEMDEYLQDDCIYFGLPPDYGNVPRLKIFPTMEEVIPPNIIDDVGTTRSAQKDLDELLGEHYFDNPKPPKLIQKFIELSSSIEDEILDFFAGSGTTAHAVMDLNAQDSGNRKWILVQLPEATDEKSEARKAGFNTIAEIARERIRRAGKTINKGDIGFKSFSLQKSNYRQWQILDDKADEKKLKQQMKLVLDKPLIDGYDERSVIYEILLKEGFSLNSQVKSEKISGLTIWVVTGEDKKLVVSFAKSLTKNQIEKLNLKPEDNFVCFDSALDDTTKVNIIRNLNIKVI